jgi:hypothetical protein
VKRELFDELVVSVREGGAILRGEVAPSRQFVWWEQLLLREPRFRTRVAQARRSVRDGQGISIEQLREKHGMASERAEEQAP